MPADDAGVSRAIVLVTGMSGTGKSTALEHLHRRGHRVVDTDDPGWTVNVDAVDGVERMWDLPRVDALLRGHLTGWLFVAGCVPNQGALYHLFDAIVLLSAPVDVILARVVNRANPFGSLPEHRAQITEDLRDFEPILRAGATVEIISTAVPSEVVAALERTAAAVEH